MVSRERFFQRSGENSWFRSRLGKRKSMIATLRFVGLVLGMGLSALFLSLPGSIGFGYAAKASPVKWTYTTGNTIYSRPAIGSDDSIYISSADTYLYAIDFRGKLLWKRKIGPLKHVHFIRSTPAIAADGTIYVGSTDYHLYAVTSKGELKWRYKTAREVQSSPTLGGTEPSTSDRTTAIFTRSILADN